VTRAPFEYVTGVKNARVVCYEDAKRKGMLYLRWRDRATKNWARKALGRVIELDGRGKITADCERFAIGAAQQKSLELASGITAPAAAPAEKAPTTISAAEAMITATADGEYPHKTPFRDELVRALRFAVALWGAETPWTAIEESHYTMLLRRRLEGLVAKECKAVRATEITVSRIITVVRWLRRKRHIPREAAPWPEDWKKDVAKHWRGVTGSDRDQQPEQLRYTLDEFQRIVAAANFDPRLFLLLRLAAGLRPGQVARARRRDLLELPVIEWDQPPVRDEHGRDLADYGTFKVFGSGKKGGVTVDLTRGQRRAIDNALTGSGYLARIEVAYRAGEIKDYALFPSGYIVGRVGMMRGKDTKLSLSEFANFERACTGSWIRKSWCVAEERAEVPHIHGRATYGGRRLNVDVADDMGLSPSGIENLGGWSGTKVPMEIYRNKENKAGRREAREARARMLGEEE
jgi:hypothetical protein